MITRYMMVLIVFICTLNGLGSYAHAARIYFSGTDSYIATGVNNTFSFSGSSTYTVSLSGFVASDVLNFPAGSSVSVYNFSFSDGMVDLAAVYNGNVITVHLTGLTTTQDSDLWSEATFNSVFGSGSITYGTSILPGDCDSNGIVTIAEAQSAVNMFLGSKPVVACVDKNFDASVSIAEAVSVINSFLSSSPVSVSQSVTSPATINLGNVSGSAGSQVTIPLIFASNGSNLSALSIDIVFDPSKLSLTMNGATPTAASIGVAATASEKGIYQSTPSSGVLRLGIINTGNTNTINDGIVANINFTVDSSATGTISVTNTNANASDSNGNPFIITGSNGSIQTTTQINGTCGSSDKGMSTSVPTSNLCSTGTTSAVTGTGPWSWTCQGSNGGTTASCSTAVKSWTVTPSAGLNGSISPNNPQTVNNGAIKTFIVTPNDGYSADVFGCGGVISVFSGGGDFTYATGAITADCTVIATFRAPADIIPPVMTNLSVTAPATGLTATINTLSATDNSGTIAAWCLTETNNSSGCTWQATKPTSYPFTSAGTKTLYAFAKDSSGNISSAASASITIILDTTAPTIKFTKPTVNGGYVVNMIRDIAFSVFDGSNGSGVATVQYQISQTIDGSTTYFGLVGGNLKATGEALSWLDAYSSGTGTEWAIDLLGWNSLAPGTYTITVSAVDIAQNRSAGKYDIVKVAALPKEPTTLAIDLTSNSIPLNSSTTVSGKLTRVCSESCGAVDLDNRKLSLTVTNPENVVVFTRTDITTDNSTGNFNAETLNGIFTISGTYNIQTTYAGDADLQGSISATKTVLVGTPAGYAVIIEGKVANDLPGLASHTKSTTRIYQTLRERNFTDDQIYWFNFGGVTDPVTNQSLVVDDTAPTVAKIGDIISGTSTFAGTKTLAQLMNDNPAPLSIIMVDHGSPDAFHVDSGDNGVISSAVLNGWLDTLDAKLTNSQAKAKTKLIIIGACYSGSFIKKPLSTPGRIIITSATEGEVSYRGGIDGQDGIQSGEYFLDELFASFKRLNDIKSAFRNAAEKTWLFTRKSGAANGVASFVNAVQHPLLDDNGDGTGSQIPNDSAGDGSASGGIYLGSTPGVNSIEQPADLAQVTPTIYLGANETTLRGRPVDQGNTLWAQAINTSQVSSMFVEILRPTTSIASTNSEMQAKRPLGSDDRSAMLVPANGSNMFTYDGFSFLGPGKYEITYYAIDAETGAPSPSKRSIIYKDNSNDVHAPIAATLVEPDANGKVFDPHTSSRIDPGTTIVFQWGAGSDLDSGDALTYKLEICTDSGFTTGCFVKDEINRTFYLAGTESGLQNGTPYYWRVWAVDPYGKRTASTARSFTPRNTNGLPSLLYGSIRDGVSGAPLTTASVQLGTNAAEPVLPNGYYLLMADATGTAKTLKISATGYTGTSINATLTPGAVYENNILLTPDIGGVITKPGDCIGDGTVTIAEVQGAVNMFLGLSAPAACVDTDEVGGVTIAEVQKVINSFLGM